MSAKPKEIKAILKNEQSFLQVAKAAFDSVDTDKSGQIDANELEKVLCQISADMNAEAPTKEDVDEVLNELDTDKSGKISFDEFKVLMKDVLQLMMEQEK